MKKTYNMRMKREEGVFDLDREVNRAKARLYFFVEERVSLELQLLYHKNYWYSYYYYIANNELNKTFFDFKT